MDAAVAIWKRDTTGSLWIIEQAWVENNLGQEAQLTISGCLGPCSMRNVVLLKSEDGLTWLGGLSGGGLRIPCQLGLRVLTKRDETVLPEGLRKLEFQRDEDFELINLNV